MAGGQRKEELDLSSKIFPSLFLVDPENNMVAVFDTFICPMSRYFNTSIQFPGGGLGPHTFASRYSGSWQHFSQISTRVPPPLPLAQAPPLSL